jgi:hypothetical protein
MSKSAALIDSIKAVAKKWTKQRKREERHRFATLTRHRFLTQRHKVGLKQAAWQVMEEAYMKASANNTLPANATQIMYAARPSIIALSDVEIRGDFRRYSNATLLPNYIAAKNPSWAHNVVFDARGHFREPHTGLEIGLGTLEVRNYINKVRNFEILDIDFNIGEQRYPTPDHAIALTMPCSPKRRVSTHCGKPSISRSGMTSRP